MPFNIGGWEFLFVLLFILLAWALPIAALIWFVRRFNDLRDTVRRIEQRLEGPE